MILRTVADMIATAHMAQFTLIAITYLGAAMLLENYVEREDNILTIAIRVHITSIN